MPDRVRGSTSVTAGRGFQQLNPWVHTDVKGWTLLT